MRGGGAASDSVAASERVLALADSVDPPSGTRDAVSLIRLLASVPVVRHLMHALEQAPACAAARAVGAGIVRVWTSARVPERACAECLAAGVAQE